MTPTLSQDQVTTILTEALARGMYEVPDGAIPTNEDQRNKDAKEIVELCLQANANGNNSDNVNSIIFIAQSEQAPAVASDNGVADSAPSSVVDGLDLTTLAPNVLDQLIAGLDAYPPSPKVEQDRQMYLAEKARRNGESPQEIPKVAQAAPQAAPAENVGENSAVQAEPQGTDAGAFARVQTAETVKEGNTTKVKAPEEDGERLKLESELTLPIVKSHGVDITKLTSLTTAQLAFMIANPEGPPKETQMPIDESEIEATAQTTDVKNQGKVVGGITVSDSGPEVVVTKADLGLDAAEAEGSGSTDRDNLESMVTGPLLKAWGRGRKEVPSIGDHELKLMILNENGPQEAGADAISKAKAADGTTPESEQKVVDEQVDVVTTISIPVAVEQDRTIEQAAQEAVAKQAEPTNVLAEQPIVSLPQTETADLTSAVVEIAEEAGVPVPGQMRAMHIIQKENFPIPPDITGEPPQLPNDISKASREELFSYHARFHACESRINWVISSYEDELGDLEKLRANREITVAASVPLVIDDKRVTNEYRDAQVAADSEVLNYAAQEHEINKVVKKLKVLQRNYHSDCERLSRQMSKYERERLDAPR